MSQTISPSRAGPLSRRVLVVGAAGMADAVQGCRAFGFGVDVIDEIYAALADVADDPAGFRALVIDCAPFGGAAATRRHLRHLSISAGGPTVILVTDVTDEGVAGHDQVIVIRRPQAPCELRKAVVRGVQRLREVKMAFAGHREV